MASDTFATGVDWLLERTVGSAMNGVSFGLYSFSDLDFANDVALIAELLELLVAVLETMGLEVNWQKTKVQALGSRENKPSTVTAQGQEVAVVEEFVYLGSLIHPTTQSSPDISRRNAITRAAMQNLDSQIWKSQISISTKLKLYNTCILHIFLYGSKCWAVTKSDVHKIDAPDQWCLHNLLGIRWYHHVRNDVRRKTKQPHLSATVQAPCLSLFGHTARMPDKSDAKQILTASPLENWRRPLGCSRTTWMKTTQQDLESLNLSPNEAINVAQNHPLWRMMSTFGALHS